MYFVEISLQEMDFLRFFQKPWPVFVFQLLLPQNKFHISLASFGLTVLNIDFTVEFKLDVIGGLLGFGVASECERSGF